MSNAIKSFRLPWLTPRQLAHMQKHCPLPLTALLDHPSLMPSKIKFEYFKANGLFFFHIRAGNRKIIAQSEGYKRVGSVFKTVNLIRQFAGGKDVTVTPIKAPARKRK